MRFLFLALSAVILTACGQVDYDKAPTGTFTGSLFVMWIGEGGRSGDGSFVFVPNPRDPLQFVRAEGHGSVSRIQPEMIYTDGGSIPRAAQLFNGFAPWGYAPAYMIHDWLFVARHCLTDETPTKAEETISAMAFQESAEIIAEAIKTLIDSGKVQQNDIAPRVISGTVAGPISYAKWEAKGACAANRVSEADKAAAEAAIPGSSKAQLSRMGRVAGDGTVVPVKPAELVATLTF
ncbi:hypothetical protein [Falsiphaeobacter marinintestinus]|uniref:hypothetical protein n=1 Tax=Falsiphaeobacter marinintestinus TaxID=1492905 RepID=UPI0011B7FAC7|nr:hypothetical protein [Phaeobacter marinintestinus]